MIILEKAVKETNCYTFASLALLRRLI